MKAHHSLTKGSASKNSSQYSGIPSKENHQPRQPLLANENREEMKKDTKGKVKIVEGDFSRIACSYVLEGDRLRKQEVYE